ncbi:MAG TPA: L-aspartate oxidase [Clostridiales bacterium]|nr:L-aspartate oxidase [Clostridiales bacterium]
MPRMNEESRGVFIMRRYLWQGDFSKLPQTRCDVVVIGTGLAGLYTALHLDPALQVVLLNKNGLDESNSMYAQGGIAAAIAPGDSPAQHFEDSWVAGAGLNNPSALQVLVQEGPSDIRQLRDWGVPFDLDSQGCLSVTREGAHHRNRIVHCHGDATGLYVTSTLADRLRSQTNCQLLEKTCLVDFLTDEQDAVCGILTLTADNPGQYAIILARHVILASGGIGGLYPRTTNAATATGDGLAAALRCGAETADLEFVQFHPTALPWPDAQGRCFLISEAVRGEGGILRNHKGKAFMALEHPQADLAPRDIVSRAIYRQMLENGIEHVWLDITHRDRDFLMKRFPTIYETCARRGIDIATQWIPVSPVQHYYMGGVRTDIDGRTTKTGLWACGEAACTGIYGANRLASNSLLECLVFGRRIAQAINHQPTKFSSLTGQPDFSGQLRLVRPILDLPAGRVQTIRLQIRQIMDRHCGILRNQEGLELAAEQLGDIIQELAAVRIQDRFTLETCQMATAAKAIIQAAMARTGSVGAHFRTDDPAGKLNSVV